MRQHGERRIKRKSRIGHAVKCIFSQDEGKPALQNLLCSESLNQDLVSVIWCDNKQSLYVFVGERLAIYVFDAYCIFVRYVQYWQR